MAVRDIFIDERAIIAFVAKSRFSIGVLDEWNDVPKSTAKSCLQQHHLYSTPQDW